MYTCDFCGLSSENLDDFEPDYTNNKGFWCPCCDGFTHYNQHDKSQSFKLFLEIKASSVQQLPDTYKFPVNVSPLRYPGGKSKLSHFLLNECNSEHMVNFAEPFCGGASVGLSYLLAGKCTELWLNDKDFGVYSLFTMIKTCPELLISKIKEFKPTKHAFQKAKAHIEQAYFGLDYIEAGWKFFIVNRMAFSGIVKANCMTDCAARWNPKTLIQRIQNISAVSEHIHVSTDDACKFIEEMYWRTNTTIFVDPPYVVKGKDLYSCYYSFDDHIKLANLLDELYKGCPGADMLVTYDYTKEIMCNYNYPQQFELQRQYCIA